MCVKSYYSTLLLSSHPSPVSLRNWDKDQVSDQTNHFIHGNAELNGTTWIISHSEASLQLSLRSESWDPSMGREFIMNKLFLKLENLWDASLYLLGLFFQFQIRKAVFLQERRGWEDWHGEIITLLLQGMEYKTISFYGHLRIHREVSISALNFQILMSYLLAT